MLLIAGLAQAGGDGELVGEGVAELAETGPRGVLVAQAHPVVRVARRALQEPGALVEVGGVAAVEVERAGLPLQGAVIVAGQAEFLGPLVQVTDLAHRLAIAVRHAIDREVDRGAAVGVTAAVTGGGLVRGDRGEVDRAEVITRLHRTAVGLVRLRVVVGLVVGDLVTRHVGLVRALGQRVAQEQGRGAFVVAGVGRGEDRELVARGQQQLRAHVAVVEAAHGVLLRADRAVGAGAGVGVVDVVVAVLVQGRHAERGDVVDRSAEATVDRHAVVGGVAGADAAAVVLGRLEGVELDDAGGGVAAEQRALRTAQHFHLVHVIDRVGLQHHVFQHDVVLDDRHRLRGTQVEIDVAQAADVEAREDAAGGGFRIQARHAAGQRQQGVVAAGGEVAHALALHHAYRHRHFLQVLLAVLGGHGDGVQPGRGRRTVLCGSTEAGSQGQACTGQGQRMATEGNEGGRHARRTAGIGMGRHRKL
ncbi:hypothetical protein D3C72_1147080 [compost metagenome]